MLKTSWWVALARVLSGVPFGMGSFILLAAVPKFKEIFAALGGDLPRYTSIVWKVSVWARQVWPLYAVAVLAMWGVTWRYLLCGRSAVGRRATWIACGALAVVGVVVSLLALFLPVFHA